MSRKRKLMWRDLTFRSFRVSASAPLEHMDKPRNVCGVLSVADVGQFQGICGTPGLSMGAKAELPPSSNVFRPVLPRTGLRDDKCLLKLNSSTNIPRALLLPLTTPSLAISRKKKRTGRRSIHSGSDLEGLANAKAFVEERRQPDNGTANPQSN